MRAIDREDYTVARFYGTLSVNEGFSIDLDLKMLLMKNMYYLKGYPAAPAVTRLSSDYAYNF